MDWIEIKENIYFEDGAYRDILISEATQDDWRKWVDYVTSKYRVSTIEHETQLKKDTIDLDSVLAYWGGKAECCATTSIYVGNVIVNCHYFDDKEFENDITPKEVTTEKDHIDILKYMTDISLLLNKPVIMTLENCPDIILMTVNRDKVSFTDK